MSPVRNTSLARLAHRLSPAAFLRWWGQGLWLCLPPALRERLSGPPPQLLIEQVDDELRISEVDGSRVKELSRYPRALLSEGLPDVPRPRDREVVLCLTPRQTLARTLNLPLAAEANLRQVVGFELDRLTPFPPNRIYYDARVIERRTDQRSVRVRFVAVLRDTLEPLLAQLRASGLAPERVVLAGDDSGCNLLPAERRRRRRRWGERVQLMLMVLLGITILVALALPLWQLRSQVVDLLPRVAVARQEA
ncbi:MAG: hypothetical protein R3202_10075, partial [Candidatus Competibacterales bacterium]|nr:hypothetical protein [Candidatus Competibacterales bacterium]